MEVLCVGEAVIDFVSRQPGQSLVQTSNYTAATGGAPANVAAGLAKLGRNARLVATVGDDIFGQKIQHDLSELGVDCRLRFDDEHFTTISFVRRGTEGAIEFEFNPGAHDYLTLAQIEAAEVASARVLHVGSISLRTPDSRQATLRAIELAKDAGILCSVDPNWRPALWHDRAAGEQAMREVIAQADLLKISNADLEVLVPDHGEDFGAALLQTGFAGRLAAVTLGSSGAWYQAGVRSGHVPSPNVQTEDADATGAGDAFLAALLDRLLDYDLDIEKLDDEALRAVMLRASSAGALAASGYGATPAMPDKATLDSLVRLITGVKST